MLNVENEFCIVHTTSDSQDLADKIANELVARKLASCVQIHPITSVYRWNGAVQREQELELTIKTTISRWTDVRDAIQELHSYDVPQIVCVPILSTSDAYGQWIRDETIADN